MICTPRGESYLKNQGAHWLGWSRGCKPNKKHQVVLSSKHDEQQGAPERRNPAKSKWRIARRRPVTFDVRRTTSMDTRDQQKDAERLARHIQREQLVSCMNDTKWGELRAAMASVAPNPPRYRVKCLRDAAPSPEGWERDWRNHLPSFKTIEWVEVDPIHRTRRGQLLKDIERDMTDDIVSLLRGHSIPFEHSTGHLRIYGWRRGAG